MRLIFKGFRQKETLMELKSIAVYCGSMKGNNPLFAQKAAELGKLMA